MSLTVQKLLLFSVLDAVVFAMATKKCKAEEMEVAEVFTVWSPNYHQSSAAKKNAK